MTYLGLQVDLNRFHIAFELLDQPPPTARYSATQAALRSRSKLSKAVLFFIYHT